jgi:hypothetical protein
MVVSLYDVTTLGILEILEMPIKHPSLKAYEPTILHRRSDTKRRSQHAQIRFI